jgi:hypothetical protein
MPKYKNNLVDFTLFWLYIIDYSSAMEFGQPPLLWL